MTRIMFNFRINDLSLEEKISQLFIITTEQLPSFSIDIETSVPEPGGVILFKNDLLDLKELQKRLSLFSNKHGILPFISIDEEGGRVSKLREVVPGYDLNSPFFYKADGESAAKEHAKYVSAHLKRLGINTVFAPVADVWSNKSNTVIADRAYSDDFWEASLLVNAAVRGFKEEGMICCLKHWPGHGDTKEDSHREVAYLRKPLQQLKEEEFLPFRTGIEGGADMVMTSHVVAENIDDVPASLSKRCIDILREDYNYKGLIITDSLQMKGVSQFFDEDLLSLKAFIAGNDIALMPTNYGASLAIVIDAVKEGIITEDDINEKLSRVLSVKEAHGLVR